MKAVCITGADQLTLDAIAAPMYSAGLKQAASIERTKKIDFNSWHEAVGDSPKIGRVWQSVAEDLVLANIDEQCWGWHNTKAVNTLEYLADLDPSIHFILVCTKPEQAYTRSNDGKANLETWYAEHKRLLDFYLANPERSVLIDADSAIQQTPSKIKRLSERWQLPIEESTAEHNQPSPAKSNIDYLASLLAREAAKELDCDICSLYRELLAAQHPIHTESGVNKSLLVEWFNSDINGDDLAKMQSQLVNAQQSIARSDELIHISTAISQKNDIQLPVDSISNITPAEVILSHIEALESKAKRLGSEHDQLKTRYEQAQSSLKDAEDVAKDNRELENQLNLVQEEMETLFSSKTALETQLKKERDLAESNFEKLKQEAANATQSKADIESNKALEEDNELLEQQLLQVQEELEHYFTKYQELAVQQDEDPKAISTETPIADAVGLSESGSLWNKVLAATIKNFQVSSDNNVSFEAKLTKVKEGIQISSSKLKEIFSFTTRDAANQFTISTSAIAQLQELHPADRQQLCNVLKLIKQALVHSQSLSKQQKRTWSHAIEDGLFAINSCNALLSFSNASLRGEQTNGDYEHLWLVLEDCEFGQTKAEQWSLRLSCANVSENSFGDQPKLQIPEQKHQLMTSWYSESSDDFGQKYELRFAKPNAMDVGVYSKLNDNDKQLIKALVKLLPSILLDIKSQGRYISRDWLDWLDLAHDMNETLEIKGK